ncbi:beta-ketoacyl synthase N-terminal-like domain-containing protein [Oceanibaculum indicum]|uniref:Polyketide beta-ketoacyl:acyl carrier protein synthase n=1 Tax=Oceanibaculum indicum P24 TaxID=1207063 RepID=K2KEM4_9PROT|nr:beta-ketoacyl synthase N-terminal-like domain-containing protein [Oceanibaculum indicum]EKE75765.1 polyketide beta-ketoacyl:acyl carrier protein synthase [Oceanibaculum indicum P24]
MPSAQGNPASIVIAGIGVAAGRSYGKQALRDVLFGEAPAISPLRRDGRQLPDGTSSFIGLELPDPPELLPARIARTAGLPGRAAIAVLDEAWREAGLEALDPARIGLVVGGSNLMAREQMLAQRDYAGRMAYWPPRHGHMFLDTDIAGLCASAFPIRGFTMSVGGASASGAVAVIQAAEAVRSGRVDACIALGALQDVSCLDLQGFQALGALAEVCRPFDRDHAGFVYGESTAALVLCRADIATEVPYGTLAGWAHLASGNRGPEPSMEGELAAIRASLAMAGLPPEDIEYVNAHATGTPLGDATELAALRAAGLDHARINATKSLIGHGLASAGAVELAATLIQMRDGRLHPTRHLDNPQDPAMGFVRGAPEERTIRTALKLSFGFGGVDTALVIREGA